MTIVAVRVLCCPIPMLLTLTLGAQVIAAQSTGNGPSLGPVLPEQSELPSNPGTQWAAGHDLRFFGWANGGYTWSSTGTGLLEVEPRAAPFRLMTTYSR